MTDRSKHSEDQIARLIDGACASRDVSPGPGFTARMISGAMELERGWRRRRIAIGIGATLSVGVAAVVMVIASRGGEPEPSVERSQQIERSQQVGPRPAGDPPVDEAREPSAPASAGPGLSADWAAIQKPLATTPLAPENTAKVDAAEKKVIQLRADADVAALELRLELQRDRPDAVRVSELIDQIGAIETEMRHTRIMTWVRVRNGDGDTTGTERQTPPPRAERSDCDEVACLIDPDRACCKALEARRKAPPLSKTGVPVRLNRSDISEGIDRVRGKVAACGAKHSFEGKVAVRMRIGSSGRVSSATARGGSASVRRCVEAAVTRARFRQSQKGVSVNYPFVLR